MTEDARRLWDEANPLIWRLFRKLAWQRWHALGRRGVPEDERRFSARVIVGKLRWDAAVATTPDEAGRKINDHMAKYYGVKFMDRYPACEAFFQLRAQALPGGQAAPHMPRGLFGG